MRLSACLCSCAELTGWTEVGQALLQRHEAYVRRQESQHKHNGHPELSLDEERESDDRAAIQDQLDELTKENKALEKVRRYPVS